MDLNSLIRVKQRSKVVVAAVSLVLLAGACGLGDIETDIEVPNHQGTFGMAIGSTVLSIQELVEELEDPDISIEEENSGLLKVVYRDTTNFDDVADVISIDDVSNPGNITPGIAIPASPIDTSVMHTEELSFTYPIEEGYELDQITYSAGTITLEITSTFADVDIEYEFVLDDITNIETGEALTFSGTINSSGTASQNAELLGYQTIATRDGDDNVFTGTFNGTLNVLIGDEVNAAEELNYSLAVTGADYQTIYGYFGEQTIDLGSETINTDFFDEISENGLSFADPTLTLSIQNGFGIQLGLDLSGITSTNASGEVQALLGSITESLQFVQRPSINSVGDVATSAIEINSENSNLSDILASSPQEITFSATAQTNFNVEDPSLDNNRNWVDQSSTAQVAVEIELPMEVRLSGFNRPFEVEIAGSDVKDADTVNIRIHSINMLPFDGVANLQILDESEQLIFEEQEILLFKSPVPEQLSGRVETPSDTTIVVSFFEESLTSFETASTLSLQMNMDSYQADQDNFVKIFSDYDLELIVSVEAVINAEL